MHQGVGHADTDDGPDQRVRGGRWQAEPPRAEVPEDGGDQQGKHHREAGVATDLQDELDGQERDDSEGDGADREQHAEEIERSGPDDREIRRQAVRIDDGRHGIGGVVEAVDELEPERDQQSYTQQEE